MGGGGGDGSVSCDKKTLDFVGYFRLNYVICNFAECALKLLAMWEDRGSIQHGKELT